MNQLPALLAIMENVEGRELRNLGGPDLYRKGADSIHLPWGVGEEGRGGGSAVAVLLRLGGGRHHVWGRVLHLVLADATQHLHRDGF